MSKKVIYVLIALIIIVVGIILYMNYLSSPKYSLSKIKESVENHDVTEFEKYVDVNGVITRLFGELPALIEGKDDSGLFDKDIADVLANVFHESIVKIGKEAVKAFVERGYLKKKSSGGDILSSLVKDIPFNTFKIVEIKSLNKEGKICKIIFITHYSALDGDFELEIMMRDKGRYWQVAEISNLPDIFRQITELKKSYPRRYYEKYKTGETISFVVSNMDTLYPGNEKYGFKYEKLSDIKKGILQYGGKTIAEDLECEYNTDILLIQESPEKKYIYAIMWDRDKGTQDAYICDNKQRKLILSLKTSGYYMEIGTNIIWSKSLKFAIIPETYRAPDEIRIVDLEKATVKIITPEPIVSIVKNDWWCKSLSFDSESFKWTKDRIISFIAIIKTNPYAENNNCSRRKLNKEFGKYVVSIPINSDTAFCVQFSGEKNISE